MKIKDKDKDKDIEVPVEQLWEEVALPAPPPDAPDDDFYSWVAEVGGFNDVDVKPGKPHLTHTHAEHEGEMECHICKKVLVGKHTKVRTSPKSDPQSNGSVFSSRWIEVRVCNDDARCQQLALIKLALEHG